MREFKKKLLRKAKEYRALLDSLAIHKNTYTGGFDVGYNLGFAQAMEMAAKWIEKFGKVKK